MLPAAACLGAGGWTIDHRCGGRNKNSGVGVARLGRVFVSGRSEAGVAWASKEEQGGVAGLHAHWRCRCWYLYTGSAGCGACRAAWSCGGPGRAVWELRRRCRNLVWQDIAEWQDAAAVGAGVRWRKRRRGLYLYSGFAAVGVCQHRRH